jgi:hypothetical protein
MALMEILGGLGSIFGASEANQAAKAAAWQQTVANKRALQFQRRLYNETKKQLTPYRDAGSNALGSYLFEMGLGDQPEGYGGYMLSPEAQFTMGQGEGAINAAAAGAGGLASGRTLEALTKLRMGIASQDRGNYLNRLGGLVDTGMSAASMGMTAGQNAAAGMANAWSGIGNAQSAGSIAQGNNMQNLLGNLTSLWGYQNAQPGQQNTSGIGWSGWKLS